MKQNNLIQNILCTMLIPIVLLFTMGFAESIGTVYQNPKCCRGKVTSCSTKGFELNGIIMAMFGWESSIKNSGLPCQNHPKGCEKSFCVHFFCNEEKRKPSANPDCC